MGDAPAHELRRALERWQILMITISGIIGVTVFQTSGLGLRIAGPGGLLTAFSFIGLVAIFVMDGISELVDLWPVSNAMFEWVEAFLDKDLARVVAVGYWYTYSSVFATLITQTSSLSEFWGLRQVGQILLFYIFWPLVLIGLNLYRVEVYGYIETVSGALKLMFVCGGALLLWALSPPFGLNNIADGFKNDLHVANSAGEALCIIIPILAYGFIGMEIVTVTAFEAVSRESLRFPANYIAYIVFVLYFCVAMGESIVVNWQDDRLPTPWATTLTSRTSSALILPVQDRKISGLPGFLNICIIFAVLSAANTALYVSSRTLFGLTRRIRPDRGWPFTWFAKFGTTMPGSLVPAWAVIVSALSFIWLPFLTLKDGPAGLTVGEVVEIMATIGSTSCMVVWMSLCITFIRYRKWLYSHRDRLIDRFARYNRWDQVEGLNEHSSLLSYFQPVPAWLGLFGCFFIVLIFPSASWWNGAITFRKVAVAYAGPFILLIFWVILKIRSRRGWVELDDDWAVLERRINYLETLSREGENQVQLQPLRPAG